MKEWKESKDDLREVTPDREMAESLLKMIEIRSDALKLLDAKKHTSIIVDGYYEIIKEAITALMAVDGYKTTSHEVLIGYLKEFHDAFSDYEIRFIDEMRKIRNKINYKGFFVKEDYLRRNMLEIKNITSKLTAILKNRLREKDQ